MSELCTIHSAKYPIPTALCGTVHLGIVGEEAGVLVVKEVGEEVLEEGLELRDSGTRG